ncbi:magnesium-dependent phosphatase-1 [Mycena rebaudengoi]|nr:magnesium-dependent phosphatase-1 [Mycena rebaudengoi]
MFPQLIAFDLDYTLWGFWIETHTGPLQRFGQDEVVDAHGAPIEFYPDVPALLRRLHEQGVIVAACSRTHTTDLAREALTLLLVPAKDGDDSTAEPTQPQPAIELFSNLQIYPGSKLTHFRTLHAETGIPYEQMLFFDDEPRNREVERLGVTFHLTPRGMSNAEFDAGVKNWAVPRSK